MEEFLYFVISINRRYPAEVQLQGKRCKMLPVKSTALVLFVTLTKADLVSRCCSQVQSSLFVQPTSTYSVSVCFISLQQQQFLNQPECYRKARENSLKNPLKPRNGKKFKEGFLFLNKIGELTARWWGKSMKSSNNLFKIQQKILQE